MDEKDMEKSAEELNEDNQEKIEEQKIEEQKDENTLEEKLKVCEEEKKRYYDNWLRAEAELDNYKKRVLKEKEEFRKFALEGLIKEILTPVDYLEMAICHAKTSQNTEALIQGVEYTLKSILNVLKSYGVEAVDSEGKLFDPALHEAQCIEEREDVDNGVVLKEHRKAYKINGRLLRAAIVTVSKKPEQKKENIDLKDNEKKEA